MCNYVECAVLETISRTNVWVPAVLSQCEIHIQAK